MSLTNPNTPVSQHDLQDFYHRILPYLGGSNEGGSGHTIEDAEGTSLTQRDTLQFGEGFSTTDDPTNEKTIVDIDSMSAEDMDEIINELPTGGNIAVTGYVPLGTLISFYGETAPKFFLACDGSIYNKADYPELANHLLSLTDNTSYIVDGDDTKFKVPDLRGEFLRGTGTNSHTNQGGGDDVGVHQDSTEFPMITMGGTGNNVAGNLYRDSTQSSNLPSNEDKRIKTGTGNIELWYASSTKGSSTSQTVNRYSSRPTNTSVLFCIAYKDIYSNPMNDYSTDEKVVGTWINGKPIYQKTVETGALPNASTKNVAHNISNLGIVVDMRGWFINTSVTPNVYAFFNYTHGNSSSSLGFVTAVVDSTNIMIKTLFNLSAINTKSYVTIQYTKTTD